MCFPHGKCKGIFQVQSPHCLVTLDQWDCFQNVLEKHGGREFFPNHQNNTDIFFSNLLLKPNKLSIDHQTNAVFVNDDFEDRILSCKNSVAPSSSLCNVVAEGWPLSSKDGTKQDFVLMVQCQSIFFHVLVWLLLYQRRLSVVFVFAFDLAANHIRACLWNFLFLWICRNFCVVLNWVDHIFDRSIGNSNPGMRIVLIHRPNSNFNSIFKVLKTGRDFQYKSNPHISLNPSFWLRSWIVSKKSVFATSHWTKLSEITSVLVMRYCPISTTRINPASIQNLLILFSGESDSIRWMYCCQKIWSFMGFSFCRGASALTSPRTIDCPTRYHRLPLIHLDGSQILRLRLPLLRRQWADWQKG